MKCRKLMIVLLCLALTPLFTCSAYAVNSASSPNSIGSIDSSDSIQEIFAKLQAELAQQSKNQAMQSLEKIKDSQEEMKKAAEYAEQARQMQSQVQKEKDSDSQLTKKSAALIAELQSYMDQRNLSYPASDSGLYGDGDWAQVIGSLEQYQEKLGAEVQQEMAAVQDDMGKYNSYLSNVSISNQNSVKEMTSLAKGQSLFSTEGGTINVTPVAASALAGVLIGMILMWLIMKQREKRAKKEDAA